MTRFLGAAGVALLIALPGCAGREPETSAAALPSRSGIDSLRSLGRYDEALAAARARGETLARLRSAPRWLRDDAAREVATLARIAAAPDSVRAALAEADAATARAESLEALGLPLSAGKVVESQLRARRRFLGAAHPEVASSLRALAALSLQQGEKRLAHDFDAEALAIRRRALGPRHPAVAESYDALGMDLKAVGGNHVEAMRLYRHGLTLRRALLGEDSDEAIASLTNIANLHRLEQRPDSALAIFRRVLAHRRRGGAAERGRTGDVLFSMAMTLAPRGAWSEAEPLLREAVACAREQGPAARVSLARALGAHGLALRHLGRLAEAEPAIRESGELFEGLRRGAAPGMSSATQFPLVSYAMLAGVQLERGKEQDAWLSMERSLARILLDELVARGACDTTGWWSGALARVQRALPADAALIGWLTQRPGAAAEEYPFWCYAIRHTGPVHWRRVGRPETGATGASDLALDQMRNELRVASAWPLRITDAREMTTLGRAAYALRIAPLEPWLEGTRRLVVVSPDFLHATPVEALVDSAGRYLSDRFTISYAPSALLYAAATSAPPAERRPWSALLIGDAVPAAGGGAPRLAAAESEVRDIASLTSSPTVLLGADASKERLRRLGESGALGRFRLIHFATHSAGDQLWLGRSALMLSPSGAAGAAADAERITVDEILAAWRLDADLVTLAACQSITGPASATEGFLGLHQAFLGAGARNVVVSLWPVDDEATSMLMKRFYRLLLEPGRQRAPSLPAAEALAEARRWLSRWRAPDGSTPYAHPIYWAGFVLVSGGRPAA